MYLTRRRLDPTDANKALFLVLCFCGMQPVRHSISRFRVVKLLLLVDKLYRGICVMALFVVSAVTTALLVRNHVTMCYGCLTTNLMRGVAASQLYHSTGSWSGGSRSACAHHCSGVGADSPSTDTIRSQMVDRHQELDSQMDSCSAWSESDRTGRRGQSHFQHPFFNHVYSCKVRI